MNCKEAESSLREIGRDIRFAMSRGDITFKLLALRHAEQCNDCNKKYIALRAADPTVAKSFWFRHCIV